MSRSVFQVPCCMNQEQFNSIVSQAMMTEGFSPNTINCETVWKKGNGFLTAPQFLKIQYFGNYIEIAAWLKFAWLPFVYSGEMSLDGSFGFAVKEVLKERVNRLIAQINYVSNANSQNAPEPQAKFCSECGNSVAPGTKFCSVCGKEVTV